MSWKADSEEWITKHALKHFRRRQFDRVVDDEGAYHFKTVRKNTRYRQKNYVRTPYTVTVDDAEMRMSFKEIEKIYEELESIGLECSRKKYHSKDQRKLLTDELRQKIMERDNYTCQSCGPHMPDGFGIEIDHIIPVSKGGKTVESNLQVLCSKCNRSKGNKL